jgi:hypothetical protein
MLADALSSPFWGGQDPKPISSLHCHQDQEKLMQQTIAAEDIAKR